MSGRRHGGIRPGSVQYHADLSAGARRAIVPRGRPDDVGPPVEQVVVEQPIVVGRAVCVLMRFGRPIVRFLATSTQLKRIKRGVGKLSITSKMIELGRLFHDPYGA